MSSRARRGGLGRWLADGLVTAFLLLIGAFGSHFAQENQEATGTLRTQLDALGYALILSRRGGDDRPAALAAAARSRSSPG